MARINIEDSLFKDSRWVNLLLKTGCRFKAMGLLANAWILAQEHWLKYGNIPKKAWPNELNILIEVELASITPDGNIYVKGSKRAFSWLIQKSQAGQVLSESKLTQLNKARNSRKKVERTLNGVERDLNGTEALTPTPTHSLTLTQSHPKISKGLKKPLLSPNNFISVYCEKFKERYGTNPIINGKESGIAKRLANSIDEESFNKYIDGYFHYPDPYLAKTKHPLAIMEIKLNEIKVFIETGNYVTSKQVQQADVLLTNSSLRDQVRKGKL